MVSVDGYRCLLRPLPLPDADGPPVLSVRTRSTRGFPTRTHEFLNASLAVRIVAGVLAQEVSGDPRGVNVDPGYPSSGASGYGAMRAALISVGSTTRMLERFATGQGVAAWKRG